MKWMLTLEINYELLTYSNIKIWKNTKVKMDFPKKVLGGLKKVYATSHTSFWQIVMQVERVNWTQVIRMGQA